jgi:hypothetical protein
LLFTFVFLCGELFGENIYLTDLKLDMRAADLLLEAEVLLKPFLELVLLVELELLLAYFLGLSFLVAV